VSKPILAKGYSGSAAPVGQVGSPAVDIYFSVDVESDGPIPGPYSMLSFALVPAGRMDGVTYTAPMGYEDRFYVELRPISDQFEPAALAVNGLDRERLAREGADPSAAMRAAADWLRARCAGGEPVLVAYPLGFDWSWIHWYFVRYTGTSPFKHSRAFDLKTAVAVTEGIPISHAGRARLPKALMADHEHTHHAADDAIAQAEIFAKLMTGANKRRDR
jgi:DNA polymerase III epsilon subunit-like protein